MAGVPITIAGTGFAMAGIEAPITAIADTGAAGVSRGNGPCYASRTVHSLTNSNA